MFYIIKFWKEISNIISFLANICVLVITVYTLYLTAFCRKLRFITIGFSVTQFFGESMSISIANKSLHAISITEIFIMKKKFKLQDLDCANCAAKMEEAIKKIEGVNDASMSFMTQKLTIDAADERFDAIMDEVVRVCAKVEPDMKILR